MLIKSNFFIRHKKFVIILVILSILLVGILYFNKSNHSAVAASIRKPATVTKGDLNVSITGSSSIVSSNSKSISAEVSATVTDVHVNIGDRVSKGDVLLVLDDTPLSASIKTDQQSVNNLQTKIKDLKADISNLNVKSTHNGYVSNLKYKVGDTVNKNSEICTLTDKSTYVITTNFYYNSAIDLKVGDSASLFLTDTFATIYGTVSFVSDLKEFTNGNTQIQTVEISVINPGYPLDGLEAITTVQTASRSIQSISTSTFDSGTEITFKCPSSGTIKELYIRDGSYVASDNLVLVLENDTLYDELSDTQSSLSIAYENLTDTKNDASLYTITAPIDGLITELDVVAGDAVRNGTSLVKIVNNYTAEFDIDVDELDISNIKLGQDVNITIDAIEETNITPIVGTVSNIALEGTVMNSVTSYPVTISFTGNDDIKIGMNANAEIIVDSRSDVLLLPVEAITSRKGKSYVTMEDNSEKEVEIGLYNEDYIEITSGLSEGDVVLLPATVTGSSSKQGEVQSNGFMNGFSGGMPSGGMPSGGMPSMNGNSQRSSGNSK